jgi:hypothetical protein
MNYLIGIFMPPNNICWQYSKGEKWETEEGLKVSFSLISFSKHFHRREALKIIENVLTNNYVEWISPGIKEWKFDLDKIKKFEPDLVTIEWLSGSVLIEPDVEVEEKIVFNKPQYITRIAFYITPEIIRSEILMSETNELPVEILNSIKLFKADYPEPNKTAFIIMKFGKTNAHDKINEAIKKTLASVGITGLRADDKQYHDDLFYNILTYLYGCNLSVAVFERIEKDEFNPNVSLEVGYMLALKKPVCLIKDKTLETLQTDLVGKLYREFDPYEPECTISESLNQWLTDKGLK